MVAYFKTNPYFNPLFFRVVPLRSQKKPFLQGPNMGMGPYGLSQYPTMALRSLPSQVADEALGLLVRRLQAPFLGAGIVGGNHAKASAQLGFSMSGGLKSIQPVFLLSGKDATNLTPVRLVATTLVLMKSVLGLPVTCGDKSCQWKIFSKSH